MSDFLLELRSEEIPARMQAGARAELEKLFRRETQAAGISAGEVAVWSTPRRLALIARGLPESTEAVREEAKGPPEGAPDAAVDGFCRKNGVTRDQLELREIKGRPTWFAVIEKPGRATRDVLAEAIPAIARDFAWPKSMRWGAASISTGSLRWVRPLSGIVAIFGEDLIECEVDGVRSGYATHGHRFHCPGEITIGGAHDYAEKLRACHVIVDHEERAALIREGARKAAAEAGLALIEDEGLVTENAGLTEWPMPLLGRFDEAFLDVPPEVIQLTARTNQKYFVLQTPPPLGEGNRDEQRRGGGWLGATQTPSDPSPSGDGPPPPPGEGLALANAFVCTANIEAEDGGAAIVDGNRKVLAARLSDARFFWEQDRKTPLAEHAKKLERITFHEKLGTVADKVERVAKLARWLVEEGIVKDANPDLAEAAARLAKADLVTEMVGEFPELQGLMGGYYARAEGLPDEVADAIRDHYKPVGQGDDVPTAPITVAVSLADKLDTLAAFFAIDEKPTGSKDPYALRRAVLACISLFLTNDLRASLGSLIRRSHRSLIAQLGERDDVYVSGEPKNILGWTRIEDVGRSKRLYFVEGSPELPAEDFIYLGPTDEPEERVDYWISSAAETEIGVLDFLADRLKVQQREAGVRHDLIDAVFALGNEDDLVRLLARVNALQAFIETEDGANLLAAYKRASNILKKEDWRGIEGQIAQTGEEDPLANVDDPDLAAVVAAKMAERHTQELSYTPEPAEEALIEALHTAEPAAARAVEEEDFAAAMAALATLRAPIDRFFDEVTVNADEENKRAARLDLLARFRAAVHKVADFSRIEG